MGKHSPMFEPAMMMHLASGRSLHGLAARSMPKAFRLAAPAETMQSRPL
jgi:hypothetical protein